MKVHFSDLLGLALFGLEDAYLNEVPGHVAREALRRITGTLITPSRQACLDTLEYLYRATDSVHHPTVCPTQAFMPFGAEQSEELMAQYAAWDAQTERIHLLMEYAKRSLLAGEK